MYDNRVWDVDQRAKDYGLKTLKPASNTIIVKKAAESTGFTDWLEGYDSEVSGLEIAWSENTVEIVVKNVDSR